MFNRSIHKLDVDGNRDQLLNLKLHLDVITVEQYS